MAWVICFFVGLVVGGASVFALLMDRHRKVMRQERDLAARSARVQEMRDATEVRRREIGLREAELQSQRQAFEGRVIQYGELQQENLVLKRDLQNVDVNLHKLQLDTELLAQRQRQLDERGADLARRYLKDTVKSIGSALNSSNYAASKNRLASAIASCRDIGFAIPPEEEDRYVGDLKGDYERVVKAAIEREEQARIKAQIREEERLRREVERELAQTERERLAVQAALDRALAEARDQHSEEVDRLRARLLEAEARSARAVSLAQQTKAGNVYAISNMGAFGKGVFKIGMTRRLEPLDRVRELGDASVPFPFDVHMMISCTDAPALENALHRALHKHRINRVNPRKEFFRVDLDTVLQIVREHHGEVQYVADAEALEFNQSLSMTEEDADYVESVFEAAGGERDLVAED